MCTDHSSPTITTTTPARHISACVLQIRTSETHTTMSASDLKKSTFQPSLSLAVVPVAFPPVTANPMGLSPIHQHRAPKSSGALPLQFSLTGQHANPFTQGRLDAAEGVTRAEVNGTNFGRARAAMLVHVLQSGKLVGL